MSRRKDVDVAFLQTDRIWPASVASNRDHVFVRALIEVLTRLPNDAYDVVERSVGFCVAEPHIIAFNVPFERRYPSAPNGLTVRFETIVFFERTLSFPFEAFVGLIAHELAHSLQSFRDYETDEGEADCLVT